MRVFLSSPWIPAEWIRAHGLEAGLVWYEERFRRAALPLSGGVCALAESVLQFAAERPNAAVVFASSCDQLRRAFDAAQFRGGARLFLFNLPATQTPAAKLLYRDELRRLGQFLVEIGGTAPSPEALGNMCGQPRSPQPFARSRPAGGRSLPGRSGGAFPPEGVSSAPAAFAGETWRHWRWRAGPWRRRIGIYLTRSPPPAGGSC